MEIINQYHQIAAVFIARVFLGCLFFFQGYDAVFNIKIKNIIETYRAGFTNKGMPHFIIVLATWFTACTELVGGTLLLVGLFKYAALYLLGANMIIAAIGFGITTPLWDTRYVLPRLLLLLFLLVVPASWDVLLIEQLITK
jgi:putative oxidoreductase